MAIANTGINDNILTRVLYQGSPEYLPHIAAARCLIEKYVSAYWKNDIDDLEFVDLEVSLCGYLLMETTSTTARRLKIKWIARVLGIHPIRLYNDPELPF